MARIESDREDLLRDATAFVERAEFVLSEDAPAVFIGFRRNSCLSIYFGADPVYHFNTVGELRRAFVGERLFKADRGKLAYLTRDRSADAPQLIRHDLTPEEQSQFLAQMTADLQWLGTALCERGYQLAGQVPAESNIADRARRWLQARDWASIRVARTPHAR